MQADIKEATATAKGILEDIEELPERAEDFGAGIEETTTSILEWIEEHEHVTDSQLIALENMRAGLDKWLSND